MQELLNFVDQFGASFGLSLYTRTEKTNLIFQYYDSNRDGYLSQYEVKKMLSDAYGYATDSDAQWFISQLDSNRDSKLGWYEIYNVIN